MFERFKNLRGFLPIDPVGERRGANVPPSRGSTPVSRNEDVILEHKLALAVWEALEAEFSAEPMLQVALAHDSPPESDLEQSFRGLERALDL